MHASPALVWDILTDSRDGHPKILPPAAFNDFTVVEGGRGAGTVTTFIFKVAGATRRVRHIVSAPDPGRTLVESEPDGATSTTFMLTPQDEGRQTRLTITTIQRGNLGVRGVIERLALSLVAHSMQRIYQEELQRLDALAQGWPGSGVSSAD